MRQLWYCQWRCPQSLQAMHCPPRAGVRQAQMALQALAWGVLKA